jgi:hypothetical protein
VDLTLEHVAAIMAIAVAVVALVRIYLVVPILRVRDDMKQMDGLHATIDEIRSELRRNGGLTVKDSLVRVEESQVRTERGLNQIKDRLDSHIEFHLEDGKP